jgi:hypothetical protein
MLNTPDTHLNSNSERRTYQAFAKWTNVFKPTRTIACRVLQIIGICVAWSVAQDRAYRLLWHILSILFPILQTAYRLGNLTIADACAPSGGL